MEGDKEGEVASVKRSGEKNDENEKFRVFMELLKYIKITTTN